MKKYSKFVHMLLTMVLLCGILVNSMTASCDTPYKTYTVDGYGNLMETQTAYTPYESITKVGDQALSGPCDMQITEDDEIYIADSGNRRIIVSDLNGEYIKEFGSDVLVNPTGVYVTEDKTVYVADRDAKSVFVFDASGNLMQTYTKPNHPLYGDAMDFKPQKIVVNDAGNMFIVCESNTNGIVQISPTDGGTFLGYFGTNHVSSSFLEVIQRLVLTDAQLAKRTPNMPATPDNLAIDDKGLIYTVTRGDGNNTVKKLNIAGKNLIGECADIDYPVAITVGNYENILAVSSYGYVYEFNAEGELLFIYGGSDDGRQRIGLAKKIEAIDVDSQDNIYILDSDMCEIKIFKPTEFTSLLHKALYLYSKGRYTESKEPLTQVLTMNSLFDYANRAMGKALLQEENYKSALKYSNLGKDYETYSDTFWEVRNSWLRKNMIPAIGVILGIYIIYKLLQLLDKKKKIFDGARRLKKKMNEVTLVQQLKYSLYYIKHPIDGCYGVRWEGKASLLCANIILAVFIIIFVIDKYWRGFLFRSVMEGHYYVVSDIGLIIIILGLMTISGYLICTINDGEGTMKQLYCGLVYSLTPFILLRPVGFIITHIVTYNEGFLFSVVNYIMYAWIIVLLLVTVKEINNYTVKETAKIVFLTFFAAFIIILLVFVLYALWSQVFDFVESIAGEVVYRLGF